MDKVLSDAIQEFMNHGTLNNGTPVSKLADGKIAKGKCSRVSDQFVKFLKERNVESTTIGVEGLLDTPHNSVYDNRYDWRCFGHTVVIVGNLWIDWSVRQINQDAPFPYVADGRSEFVKWKNINFLA